MTTALILTAVLATAIADAGSRDDAIADINRALSSLRDVSCRMVTARGSATVQVRMPDRVRLTVAGANGDEQVTIRNGRTRWQVLDPTTVSKTVFPKDGPPVLSPVPLLREDRYRLLGTGAQTTTSSALDRLEYRGIETVGDEPCHVLATSGTRTWIAVADGLIRRHEMDDMDDMDDMDGTDRVMVTSFEQVEINQGLDDALFEYQPVEGARVTESTFVDGRLRRRTYQVDHAPVSAEAALAARGRREEIERRFQETARFKCTYRDAYRPQATYSVDASGKRTPIRSTRSGRLSVAHPSCVRLDVELTGSSQPMPRRLLVVSDGKSVWKRGADGVVFTARALEPGSLQTAESVEAVLRGVPPEGYDIAGDLPLFVLSPLAGIDATRLTFVGEALVRNERTLHFAVKAGSGRPASRHWIGAEDGVPRRIEVLSDVGTHVERTIELSQVVVKPQFDADAFTLGTTVQSAHHEDDQPVDRGGPGR